MLFLFSFSFNSITLRGTKASELKAEGLPPWTTALSSPLAAAGTTLVWEELYAIPPATPAPINVANKSLLPPFLGSVAEEYWRKPPKTCFYKNSRVILVTFWHNQVYRCIYLGSQTSVSGGAESTCHGRRSETHIIQKKKVLYTTKEEEK